MKSSLRLAAVAVVVATFLTACEEDSPTEPSVTATSPTPSATGTTSDFATDDVSVESDSFGQLTDVRVGHHAGFDRVVLEFGDEVPGYTVKYVDLPVTEDGSGDPVELLDAQFAVQIVLTPASGFDMEAGEETYKGSRMLTNDNTTEITSVASSGDFEAVLSWAVGLRYRTPFKVTTLDNPARLVVDFKVT